MKQLPNIGANLTGLESAPARALELLEGRETFFPLVESSVEEIAEERIEYAREGTSGTGSVPPVGDREDDEVSPEMVLLLDKLGERLAVERMGTRLYDALLSKYQAYGSFDGGPSEHDLLAMRAQRCRHAFLLHEHIEHIGGDPTAVTPSANLAGLVSKGFNQVLTDPRTNLLQCLEVMTMAERANLFGWEMLVGIARLNGSNQVAERFEVARRDEEAHVRLMASWLATAHGLEQQQRT